MNLAVDEFTRLIQACLDRGIRFVVIGVWAANYYALRGSMIFATHDRDLFLPLDPDNELEALTTCRERGWSLWTGDEPLGDPLDRALATRIIEQRALITAVAATVAEPVDLSLTMEGFTFEEVWAARSIFAVGGVEIPVASLRHIVESRRRANRPKDRLFLATHAEALEQLLGKKV